MAIIGKEISDFTVRAFRDGRIVNISKKDVLGHWSILFFYPADFSYVCPTELEDLAMNYDRFQNEGAEIYAISCDTEFVHQAWHEQNPRIAKVTFPMLADPNHQLVNDFGVMRPGEGVAERAEFVLDPEGRVQVCNMTADGIGRNAEELLRLLQAARCVAEGAGIMCPAKWRPGANVYKPGTGFVGM